MSAGAARGFWRRFLPVWLAGAAGVGALLLQPVPAALLEAPGMQHVPPAVLRLLVLANPLLLVTLLALLGAATAHRVGLGSRLAGTAGDAQQTWVRSALLTGLALGLAIPWLDRVLAPLLGEAWQALAQRADAAWSWRDLAFGMAYGGLAEEVMLRWGVMAGLAWLLAKAFGRRPAVFALAAVLAALLFGVGHLPALAQELALTPAIVLRTVALNALAGIAYGWLFWRRGLEAAMLAHAATHGGFALVRIAT